jgi:hypothetical protein
MVLHTIYGIDAIKIENPGSLRGYYLLSKVGHDWLQVAAKIKFKHPFTVSFIVPSSFSATLKLNQLSYKALRITIADNRNGNHGSL